MTWLGKIKNDSPGHISFPGRISRKRSILPLTSICTAWWNSYAGFQKQFLRPACASRFSQVDFSKTIGPTTNFTTETSMRPFRNTYWNLRTRRVTVETRSTNIFQCHFLEKGVFDNEMRQRGWSLCIMYPFASFSKSKYLTHIKYYCNKHNSKVAWRTWTSSVKQQNMHDLLGISRNLTTEFSNNSWYWLM